MYIKLSNKINNLFSDFLSLDIYNIITILYLHFFFGQNLNFLINIPHKERNVKPRKLCNFARLSYDEEKFGSVPKLFLSKFCKFPAFRAKVLTDILLYYMDIK